MSIDRFEPAMNVGVYAHPSPTQVFSRNKVSLSRTALPLRLLGSLFVLFCLLLPVSARATLTITGFTLSPSTVVGGGVVTGTVTLSANTTMDTNVTLASSNTTVAPVPTTVTVLNGTNSKTFTFTTTAVAAATTVTITATLGTSVKTATLTVNPVALSSVTLSPTTILGGGLVTGTVTLTGNASTPTTVTLTSTNAAAPVPANVTVAMGSSTATFSIATNPVASQTNVTISAKLGTITKTAALIVTAPLLSSMTITPTTLTGGADAIGTVTISGNAPVSGLLVTLTSSNTAWATVPPVVRVPAGANTAMFLTATSPVTSTSSVTITGKIGAGTAIPVVLILQAGTTQTNSPTADASVQPGGSASSNFGTATTLRIANFGATNSLSGAGYLKFDLTGVTAAPQFATLKLTVNSGSTPSTGISHVKIYYVPDTTWTELGLTWNNAPSLDRTNFVGLGTLMTEADVPMSGGVASFNISSTILNQNLNKVITLQAISETNDSLKLFVNSREATTGQPILVLASSGARLLDVPAPAWAKATIGTDTIGTEGPSSGDSVVLGSGVYENDPGPDAVVRNPVGPTPVFSRAYRTWNAYNGYASPGLPVGWTHNYDVTVKTANNTAWSPLTLIYPDHATELWTPLLSGGVPTGAFSLPAKTPYIVTGSPSTTTGLWNSLTITFKDESHWTLTPNPNTTNAYALTNIANLAGRSVGLYYDASSRLTDCKDDINPFHTLLHLDYSAGYLSQLTEYSDPNTPRKIDYGVGTQNATTVLTSVSQMYTVTAPRDDWRYTYMTNPVNGAPFISNVFVFDPAGSGGYVNNTIGYDAVGRVSGLTDASAKSHNYAYPAQTQVTVQDVSGVALQWFQGFDSLYKNTGDTDFAAVPKSNSVLYGDTNPYLPTQVTNRNGQLVNVTYDNYGSTTSIDEPVNDAPNRLVTDTGYVYTDFALGRVDHITVGTKSPTTMTYYTNNTVVGTVLQPNGMVKTVSTPKPDTVGSASVVTTTFVYTALGNVASVTSPSPVTAGAFVTTTYNYVTDTIGTITTTKVEALGEPLVTLDPNGHSTHFRYDARGNVTAVIDASLNETDYTYNYLDQVTQVTYPTVVAGHAKLVYIYTFSDNTGPLKSTQLYNEAGTLERQSSRTAGSENETKAVSGSTEAVSMTLDSLYRPTAIIDGKGKSHLSTYNNIGQLSQFSFPLASGANFDSVKSTGFDNDHNLTGLTDGNAKSYAFDIASLSTGDSRLKAIHYPSAGGLAAFDATYTYDNYGRITNVAYGGDTYAYTYDDNDLILTETDTYSGLTGRVFSYAYNDDGSRSSMNVSIGTDTVAYTYTYDFGGRLKITAFSWGDSATNSYLQNNWMSAQRNSIINTGYTHNARGWLTGLTNTYLPDLNGTKVSFENTFTYDAQGNILSYYQEMGAVYAPNGAAAGGFTGTITYAYDSGSVNNQDRLTSENSARTAIGSSHNSLLVPYTFAHVSDASDNLTTLRGNLLSYNDDNQLVGPTYDGQGNPTLYNWGGTNTTFAWDAEDRLVSFGTAFTAGYRPDGLRAWKQTGIPSTRHYFLYDGGHVLAELDSAGGLLSAYGWGAAGLSERYEKATNTTYAYTFDPSGNLVQRHTNNTANGGTPIYADYSTLYDGFGGQRGAVTSRSGYALVNQDPVGWSGQFGGYTDQETVTPPGSGTDPLARFPLVLLGHRYYDPGAGRFLNRDPNGMDGGINLYAYCTNNPVNLCDPLGLWEVSVGGFTFDGDVVSDGLKTGLAAVANQFSGGLVGGGYSNHVGFDGAKHFAQVADAALTVTGVAGLTKKIAVKVAARAAAKLATKAGVCTAGKVSLVAKLLRLRTLCFTAGTPVQMAGGAVKPIEQVKIGDLVMSRDPYTGVTTAKQVTQTFAHTADATLTLTFSNGETIETTPTHPFYVVGQGFVPASQLGIGTSIVTRAGPAATLTARTNHTGSARVYNFEVADFHTYFVGKTGGGLWVHNSCYSEIALGKFNVLEKASLEPFTRALGEAVTYYGDWKNAALGLSKSSSFTDVIMAAIKQAKVIHFNLHGVDVRAAIDGTGRLGSAEWELNQIIKNGWLHKTKFYK